MSFFKKKLLTWGLSSIKVKYMHIRCVAHILNLVINESLKELNTSIKRVREVVRYIRYSPSRLRKFRDFYVLVGIKDKCSLYLDVPTHWNSTYLMLKSACIYQKTFKLYEENESSFRAKLGDNVPEFYDWETANNLVKFLEYFYEMTLRLSGSHYVTLNTFFLRLLSCSTFWMIWGALMIFLWGKWD